jgi:transposase
MGMTRQFEKPDYEGVLKKTIQVGEALPEDHLARFVVRVISVLDLEPIYGRYAHVGGKAIAPEVLLGLLVYGYASGVFSSRKIERATYENLAFGFVAGGLHPDHDTIANFRKTFLGQIQDLFVQILLLAQEVGVLKVGNISLDGSKIHADASKSKAVSHQHLLQLEQRLRAEVHELLNLGESADQGEVNLPGGLVIADEITRRQLRLENLAKAKVILEARAQERYEAEQAEYEAKVREREEKAKGTGRRPGGKPPQPPQPGPRDKDQYNFTDPDSRIMKNSTDDGFDQHYNVQVAVDQASLFIVACSLSNHPNDKAEAEPTLAALSPQLGQVEAAALDNGFFSPTNISACEQRGIEPYIATSRQAHHQPWPTFFAQTPTPPPESASPKVKMAFKLQTETGHEIYRLRKCTVEPVIGIIKEVLGFRQFSLRGLIAAAGEWCLVCLAFNLKRLHVLYPPAAHA